ncbi:MAG: hypothetical protein WCK09_02900 [Bacteroidota bacterium]
MILINVIYRITSISAKRPLFSESNAELDARPRFGIDYQISVPLKMEVSLYCIVTTSRTKNKGAQLPTVLSN